MVFALVTTAMLVGIGVVFWGDAPAFSIAVGIFGAMWLGFVYGTYDAFCVTMKGSPRGLELVNPREHLSQRVTKFLFARIREYRKESRSGDTFLVLRAHCVNADCVATQESRCTDLLAR